MNPLEKIENDPRLQTILHGLTQMWHYPEEFLALVVYHTDDFDLANESIEMFSEHDIDLEEVFIQIMDITDFKERCLNSEYLNRERCKEVYDERTL